MGFLHSQFFSLRADYPRSNAYYARSVLNSDLRLQNFNYVDGNNYSRLLANQTGLIDTPSACIYENAPRVDSHYNQIWRPKTGMNFAIAFLDTLESSASASMSCTITTQVEISQNNPLLGAQFKAKVSDHCFGTRSRCSSLICSSWCFEDYLLAYLKLGRNSLSSFQRQALSKRYKCHSCLMPSLNRRGIRIRLII